MVQLVVATFLLGLAGALLATPVARGLAFRLGAVDLPKKLGIHTRPTPRMGGVAIYLGWLVAVAAAGLFGVLTGESVLRMAAVVLASSLILLVGSLDDTDRIGAGTKALGQLLAGLVLLAAGIRLDDYIPGWIGYPVTLLWFVGMMNAINLLDGMDGLAAGVSAVAAAALGGLAAIQGNGLAVALAAALLGSSLAFLRCNVHPARMFMGDSGSLFLGMQLAVLGVLLAQGRSEPNWLFAPLLALGLPVLDTFGAIARRWRNGRHLFDGDRRHFYDLLHATGMSHPETVRAVWLLEAAAGLVALGVVQLPWGASFVVALAGLALLSLAAASWLGLFRAEGVGGPTPVVPELPPRPAVGVGSTGR